MVDRLRVSGDPVITEDDATGEVTGDYDAINTERGPSSVLHAEAYSGSTGGDKIQNALNEARSSLGRRVVYVGPTGPDDVSASANSISDTSLAENAWELPSSLIVGSHTTLVVDGYLFLSDNTDDTTIRNENADSGDTTRDTHIHIRGSGIVDGNGGGQTADDLSGEGLSRWRECGILLTKVDNFSIDGITVRNTNSWALVPEDCSDGQIDVRFDLDGTTNNQDGVHVIGGPNCKDITASAVGTSGDDFFVANATDNPEQGVRSGGNVEGVVFYAGANTSTSAGGLLRVAPSATGGNDVVGCSLIGGTYDASGSGKSPIRMGGDDSVSESNYKGITVTGLTVRNAGAISKGLVEEAKQFGGLTMTDVSVFGGVCSIIDPTSLCSNCHFQVVYRVANGTAAASDALLQIENTVRDCTFDLNVRDKSENQTGIRVAGTGTAERVFVRGALTLLNEGLVLESGATVNEMRTDVTYTAVTTDKTLNGISGVFESDYSAA